jgi:hypothetical protein
LFAIVSPPNIKVAGVCFTVARLRYALFYYKQNFPLFFCEKIENISFLSKTGQFLKQRKKKKGKGLQNNTTSNKSKGNITKRANTPVRPYSK